MAETRKITIEIVNINREEASAKKTENNVENNGSSSFLNKMLHPIKTVDKALSKKIEAKSVFLNQAYQQAKNLAVQTVSTTVNRYFSLSEDYMLENSYRNTVATLNKGKSLATTIIGGAITGGPVGAIVAGIGWVASEDLQNRAALSTYYQQINESNYNTNFSRIRAGLVDNGRGTEN